MIPRLTASRATVRLGLLCTAPFVAVVDFSIVSVALPSIAHDLRMGLDDVQWVLSSYALTFGGGLLVGGRAADVYGRRALFILGLCIFSLASLIGGLATSEPMLLGSRAAQGLGAALLVPAALSLITTLHTGQDRVRALGVYGAVMSAGFITGVILGGVLTELTTWRAVMFVNVPFGCVSAIVAAVFLPRAPGMRVSSLSVTRSAVGTAAVVALIYGVSRLDDAGPTSNEVLFAYGLAPVLGALFVVLERKSRSPLLPPRLMRTASLTGAGVTAILTTSAGAGLTLILTLYMQQVLHYAPLRAGLTFLAFGVPAIIAGCLAARMLDRAGGQLGMVIGLILQALGCLVLVFISTTGSTLVVLMGLGVAGFGHVTAVVSYTLVGTSDVAPDDQGAAGGFINTAQQIGTGLGLAMLAAVAAAQTMASHGLPRMESVVTGFRSALSTAAILSLLGALVAIAMLGRRPSSKGPALRPGPASPLQSRASRRDRAAHTA